VTLPVEPAREVSPAVPSRVYGAADLDVTPPESIGRQKLGGLVGAIQPGAVVTIEFIVNETGTVESAKATTSPRTLGESLLLATGLHAVKSWQFRPARRNGQAVSYRKSLSFGAY
jgi:TonB family protein